MTETEIQSQILNYLHESHVWHRRLPVGGVRHAGVRKRSPLRGCPDIFGVLPGSGGKLFMIEVKSERGTLSKEQKEVIAELEEQGVLIIIARSLEDVVYYFRSRISLPGA